MQPDKANTLNMHSCKQIIQTTNLVI